MMNFNRAIFTDLVAENIDNKATREAVFDLLEFAQKHAFKVVSGKNHKTFHYVVSTRGGSAMLFYCSSDGDVQVALGNFPHLSTTAVSRFVGKLGSLSPAFKYILRFEDKRKKGGTQSFLIKETLVDPSFNDPMKIVEKIIRERIKCQPRGK